MMLEVNTIKKQYGNFQLQCSMTIPKGRITGFVGPNGAGKSTTIKAILGLITLDSGSIQIKNKNVAELSMLERECLGVVLPDSGFSSFFTIKDICRIMKQMYRRFHEMEFLQNCNRFQLPLNKKLKEFSTGMKAKLHLLLAVSHEAELLILDEPTTGLDVIVRNEMLELIQEYMEEGNHSVLISSHISKDLESICDDLYMIQNGSIILHEDTDVLLSHYGTLKVTEQQFQTLDRAYILRQKRDSFGYRCLTNQVQYYLENYPFLVVEKGSIDDIITLMIRGE